MTRSGYLRRLEALPESWHRAAAAKARKTSVASVIREAIDQALPGVDPAERRRAADELLAAEPIELPEPEELKREIREARYGGL